MVKIRKRSVDIDHFLSRFFQIGIGKEEVSFSSSIWLLNVSVVQYLN